MGMGEPLANYARVMQAVRVMTDKQHGLGMSARGITVSTVGLVPAITKLANEDIPVTFALSLHAPDDQLRDELIPVNSRWKVDEALDAARNYFDKTGRRVSIEYALIKDMNDHGWRADLLADKLNARGRGWVHVNPIPLNPTPGLDLDRVRGERAERVRPPARTMPASPPRCATRAARRSTAPAGSWSPRPRTRPSRPRPRPRTEAGSRWWGHRSGRPDRIGTCRTGSSSHSSHSSSPSSPRGSSAGCWMSRWAGCGRWLTAVVVFLIASPLALWTLTAAEVYEDGRIIADGAVAIAFTALTVGWMLAAVVVAVLTLEFLWPSRRWRNPITVIREAIRRRDRARRYVQIVTIGSRHGLRFYESRRHGEEDELPTALVAAMNEAGVTFVKLGQVLSAREDVLPPRFIEAFSTLQMDSTPIPWAGGRGGHRRAAGPAAGRGLRRDRSDADRRGIRRAGPRRQAAGPATRVVVKIQRPRARAQVTTDLDILERLAAEAEKRTSWAKAYGAQALVEEFSRALREELDYRIEVGNTEMLRAAIAAIGCDVAAPAHGLQAVLDRSDDRAGARVRHALRPARARRASGGRGAPGRRRAAGRRLRPDRPPRASSTPTCTPET